MEKNISINEALTIEDAVFIDVRSPQEFREDALPGAYNVPILNDEERARVGTLYKTDGPLKARTLGLEIVSGQIPAKVKRIQEIGQGKPIVLYCWRGGMRSKAMHQLLDLAGVPSCRLIGGYKAYRRYINEFFTSVNLQQKFIVLYGLTGVGKSEIIQRLKALHVPAIDLEGLANHRGSVFGSVGLGVQPTQKKFESRVFAALQEFKNSPAIVVEGESRKIGKLTIPALVFSRMQGGLRVLVYDSISNRVQRICQEYMQGPDKNLVALEDSISRLQRRLGKVKTAALIERLYAGNYYEVVRELLVNYYDLLYNHPDKPSTDYELSITAENVEQAAQEIKNFVTAKFSSKGG